MQHAASFGHAGPAVTNEFAIGPAAPKLVDQIRPVQVAAWFADREKDFHDLLASMAGFGDSWHKGRKYVKTAKLREVQLNSATIRPN
jgi:hypothetical protein